MRIQLRSIAITLSIILFFFQGCTHLGPEYHSVDITPKLPSKWDHNLSKSDPSLLAWWKEFKDPTLDILMQKAYEQNLDLEGAGARILQARALLGVNESLTTPQKRTITTSLMGVRNSGETFGNGGISFDSGWELDIWGKYARGVESAEAGYYASIASYDHLLVSILSEVARNYINYRTFQERRLYASQNIEIQKRIVKMTEVQYNSGTVSELDVQQARTQLYHLESNLPIFDLQSAQAVHAIAVLLGTVPEKITPIVKMPTPQIIPLSSKKISFVQLSNDVKAPIHIPSIEIDTAKPISAGDLLRRPDLQIAELQAISKNAQIGVAQAELYPHFSLLGSIAINTNNATGDWLSPSKALTVGIGPSISWNPFYEDFYQNQVRVADAQFQESLINYNQKLLLAIQEVSNALEAYRLSKEQYDMNYKTIQASQRAFNLSSIQYDNGMVTYQRLLNTMENLVRSEDNIAITKGNIALHAISLYKALGGGLSLADSAPMIRPEMAKAMKARTDWGDLLDENHTKHPKIKE